MPSSLPSVGSSRTTWQTYYCICCVRPELTFDVSILDRLDPKADHDDGVNIPTLEELSQSSSQRKSIPQQSSRPASADPSEDNKHLVTVPQEHASAAPSADKPLPLDDQAADSSATPLSSSSPDPSTLEEEADGEGAFNPATGEINWDCPCLGGMAHGPCGEEFRAAFSCFVFSQEEPKGMDCIEKFKGMQECFRAHPDVYAAELADNDNEELDEALETERKGLIRDIQERGKESGSEQEESSHKRLLEVDPPKERKPILRTGDSTISSPGPSSLSSDPTSHPAITPKTSEVSSEPRGPTTEKSDTSRRI